MKFKIKRTKFYNIENHKNKKKTKIDFLFLNYKNYINYKFI